MTFLHKKQNIFTFKINFFLKGFIFYNILKVFNFIDMNHLYIASQKPEQLSDKVLYVSYSVLQNMLPALRSDHFLVCQIVLPSDIQQKNLKFLMHIPRVLHQQGKLIVKGQKVDLSKKLITNLGLHIISERENQHTFSKNKPIIEEPKTQQVKLAIGSKQYQQAQEIDEDDLLKDQKINLKKQSYQTCADKPRACANCSCGRKDNPDQAPISKQQLIKTVNEGKPISGCGKCQLGDSFRCATCPFKGMPAFKPGDKLQLVEDGKVIVEDGGIIIESGKVKIQL